MTPDTPYPVSTTEFPKPQPRSRFLDLLASVGDGSLESELSDLVADLVAQVKAIGDSSGGKPVGKIRTTIAIKYDRGVFEVDADVSTVSPKIIRPRTLMYAAPGGGLSRNNPQQIDAFRQVDPAPAVEQRSVSLAR